MQKPISVIAISLFTIAVVLSSAVIAYSNPSSVDECYDDHERCSERVLMGSYGVIKTTLLLTTCDLVLMSCLVAKNF